MEFQVQKLLSKSEDSLDKDVDELDIFAGVSSELTSPFNVFLRVRDIEEKASLIYFYAYSLGKNKVVIWGVYDNEENEFLIDSACKYSPNDLMAIVTSLKSRNYEYVFNSVKNRMGKVLSLNVYFDKKSKASDLMKMFKPYFLAKLIRSGILNSKSIDKENPLKFKIDELLYEDEDFFDNDYKSLIDEIIEITGNTIKNGAPKKSEYSKILQTVYNNLETQQEEIYAQKALSELNVNGKYLSNEPVLRNNPYLHNIVKHVVVNFFVLIFADMEEYRVAKYIIYLEANEEPRIASYLSGAFFYEWLLELARVFKVYDTKTFIKNMAHAVVELLEEQINRTDIGVIGGDRTRKSPMIENLALFFENFIARSKYSKVSMTDRLNFCPDPNKCEMERDNQECGLYNHGTLQQSQFDLT